MGTFSRCHHLDLDTSTTTDPLNPDSDEDGLTDGQEDVDGNGAVDVGETDPNNPDTDGDECNDGKEVNEMGTDPLATDSDGDGFGDCDELLLHGTDPLDTESYPEGKYGGSGCATASQGPKAWTWILGLLGLLSFRRRRK